MPSITQHDSVVAGGAVYQEGVLNRSQKTRSMRNRRIGILASLVAVLICQLGRAEDDSFAIRHVNVVDVISGTTKPDMAVLIFGNRIVEVVPDAQFKATGDAKNIDGTGKFLIPGMWDMHVHLGNATEAALPYLVSLGVTGVRDMGSPSFATIHRWSIEALSGKRIGPRIVAPGPILTMGDPYYWEMVVHGPADGRAAVDMLAEQGVDFIKITQTLDRDTYFAIADESRKLNITLAGHLPVNDNGMGYKVSGIEASNAGQKCFEHTQGIPLPFETQDPALIPTLLKNGTWIDPTLTTYYARAHVHELADRQDDPRLKHLAPGFRQFWNGQINDFPKTSKIPEQVFEWRSQEVLALYKAGVPLLAGTDMGFPYVFPGDVTREMELFVEAGLPPLEALRTATINPARYLNWDKVMGSVDEGKIADLVILDGDPLQDIRNTRKVRSVVLNGRFLDRQALDSLVPNFQ